MQRKASTERRQRGTQTRPTARRSSSTACRHPHTRSRLRAPLGDAGRIILRPPWPSFSFILVRAALLSREHPLHLPGLFTQLRQHLKQHSYPGLRSSVPNWQRARVYSQANATFLRRLSMPEESVSEAQYHGVLENLAVDELPPPIDRDTKIEKSLLLIHDAPIVHRMNARGRQPPSCELPSSGNERWPKRTTRPRILIVRILRGLGFHRLRSFISCT